MLDIVVWLDFYIQQTNKDEFWFLSFVILNFEFWRLIKTIQCKRKTKSVVFVVRKREHKMTEFYR